MYHYNDIILLIKGEAYGKVNYLSWLKRYY